MQCLTYKQLNYGLILFFVYSLFEFMRFLLFSVFFLEHPGISGSADRLIILPFKVPGEFVTLPKRVGRSRYLPPVCLSCVPAAFMYKLAPSVFHSVLNAISDSDVDP